MARVSVALTGIIAFAVSLVVPARGLGQGLPQYAPVNPVGTSRSGLYFQPLRDPAPGRWTTRVALDYASVIEYNLNRDADYILDSELLRLSAEFGRDVGEREFLLLSASVGGAYPGFMDGFLDWYHDALGIEVVERERRPRDQFSYTFTLPDGRQVRRSRSDLFLQDVRVALGYRHSPSLQTVVSLTLPTTTGPAGYGKRVPSVGVLNTVRAPLSSRLIYEGSLGLGFTPSQGSLYALQRETAFLTTSGLRMRIWRRQALFANLFYHSPYYRKTGLPSLDRRDLSLDFGWILEDRQGGEWRIGLTEDLEPGGPGVDLVLRFGRNF
jgi:hypothetical protein